MAGDDPSKNDEATGTEERRRTALITPVGSVTDPPIIAFQSLTPAPDCVAFLVSRQSEAAIPEIRKALAPATPLVRIIRLDDPQDLSTSLKTIHRALPGILDEWCVEWRDVTVDITGGTKVMAAALALATIWSCKSYVYVGGKRGPGGRVLPGSETPIRTVNPWEQLGLHYKRRIACAFDQLDFSLAARTIEMALETCADSERPYFESLQLLVNGVSLWDRFYHEPGRKKLGKARTGLAREWDGTLEGRGRLAALDGALDRIDAIIASLRKGAPSRPWLLDLLANAERCGRRERYDDAVARLYRFVEGCAQQALFDDCGIVTAKVSPKDLPETENWACERASPKPVELSLKKAYRLLFDKEHPLGLGWYEEITGGDLQNLLHRRNMSPLAHGTDPVSPRTYEKFLTECLRMAGIAKSDLFEFPKLGPHRKGTQDG